MSFWHRDKDKLKSGQSQSWLTAIGRKGKKYSLNLEDALARSLAFYRLYGLTEYAQGLPPALEMGEDLRRAIVGQLKWGFDQALILPGQAVQEQLDILKIKELMTQEPVNAPLTAKERYIGSFLDSKWIQPSTIHLWHDPRREHSYILLYSNQPVVVETRNQMFPQLGGLFAKRQWDGLTLREYYLLQRLECEKNKDHRFDALTLKAKKSQWTFLLHAQVHGGCLHACWNPANQSVEVNWATPTYRSPRLGCRPVIIIPLI